MNDEELENLIRRLPAPELPGEWRREILNVAVRQRMESRPSLLTARWLRVPAWLTPARAAWSGLAVAWSLILLLQASSGPTCEAGRQVPGLEVSEVAERMQERARLIVELEQPPQQETPPHPKPLGDGGRRNAGRVQLTA